MGGRRERGPVVQVDHGLGLRGPDRLVLVPQLGDGLPLGGLVGGDGGFGVEDPVELERTGLGHDVVNLTVEGTEDLVAVAEGQRLGVGAEDRLGSAQNLEARGAPFAGGDAELDLLVEVGGDGLPGAEGDGHFAGVEGEDLVPGRGRLGVVADLGLDFLGGGQGAVVAVHSAECSAEDRSGDAKAAGNGHEATIAFPVVSGHRRRARLRHAGSSHHFRRRPVAG